MYEIGQVIFIVTKKDDIVIVPVKIVGVSTMKELDESGHATTKVSYKVASGAKTYSLDDIRGSQFSTVDDAVASLRAMWNDKLAALRTRALRVAKKAFDYEPGKGVNSVDLDSPVFDDAAITSDADNSNDRSPTNDRQTAEVVVAEPGAPKMKIDISSIDAAFAK